MRPWLFIAYGGGHAAMLIPVAVRARDRGHDVRFLALTTAKKVVEGAGLIALSMSELIDYAAAGSELFGRELAAELPPHGPVALDESIAYLGASMADLVTDLGEAAARDRYAREGRHAFLPIGFFRRMLAALDPAVVIATNSPRAERAAILACGELDIPCVCAVDLFALQEVEWIGQPGYANRLCVLNEDVRVMMLDHGRRPDEVVVTGNPAFDGLCSPATRAQGLAIRRERGWDDGKQVILWASQIETAVHPFDGRPGDPLLPRQVERALREFVEVNDNFHLVVRYHPSERVVFTPAPNVTFSPREESISALLNAVDIVVVTASTVGLEAAIAGRPVISVDRSVFTADTQYARFGISTGVHDMDELKGALLTIAKSDSDVRLSMAAVADGGAATRILNIIESVAVQQGA